MIKPVLIAGGGTSGMAAALSLAHRGVPVKVFEGRGLLDTRQNLFNISPVAMDQMAYVGAKNVVDAMEPIVHFTYQDAITGAERVREYAPAIETVSKSLDSVDGLIDTIRGRDKRTWGRITIQEMVNEMRTAARQQYPDLIEFVPESKVVGIDDTEDGVRFLVETDGKTVEVDGSYGISATGGRSPIIDRIEPDGHAMYFLGADFEQAAETITKVDRRLGSGELGAVDGAAYTTVGLHHNHDGAHSMIWAQIDRPAGEYSEGQLADIVAERATRVGIAGPAGSERGFVPVKVQLGTGDAARVGNTLIIGDEVLIPYFPNSTGANFGIYTAAAASDAVAAALKVGSDLPLARFEGKILDDAKSLGAINESGLNKAVDADPKTPDTVELVV